MSCLNPAGSGLRPRRRQHPRASVTRVQKQNRVIRYLVTISVAESGRRRIITPVAAFARISQLMR